MDALDYNFRNPWIMLAVESVDGLSGFLPMVAGSYFCAEAAPTGMLASLNGYLIFINFSILLNFVFLFLFSPGLLAGAVFGAGKTTYKLHPIN
jgi:hypothetical protein